jgi:hypothetical protein
MKRNIILTAASVFIACLFSGCASDITESTAAKEYTLNGSMSQFTDASATRMAYDGSTTLKGQFKWETGDKIDVWNVDGKYIGTMSLVTGGNSNNGTFTGSLSGTPKYVTYPASRTALTVGTSNSTTLSSVPTGQGGDTSVHGLSDLNSTKNFIFAQAEVNNNSFTLKHRFAYVYLNLTINATRSTYTHAYITANIASTDNSYTMNPKDGKITATGLQGLNIWGKQSIMPIPEGTTMTDMGLYGDHGDRFYTVPSGSLVTNATGGCIYQYTGTFGTNTPTTYAVTYNVMTDGVVSTTGGNLTSGSEIVAANGTTTGSKASANQYYLFVGWYNASGTLLTTNATLSGQTITGATTYTAKFVKKCVLNSTSYTIKGKFTSPTTLFTVSGTTSTTIIFHPNGDNSYFEDYATGPTGNNSGTFSSGGYAKAYDSATGVYTLTITNLYPNCEDLASMCSNVAYNNSLTENCAVRCSAGVRSAMGESSFCK